jgi:succinoglycan biosynthesis protein ExoM
VARTLDRILVAVITYKRPGDLRRLLDSLGALHTDLTWRIVVVDNDPERSAEQVAREHPLRPTYAVESTPGIAAARNRCLDLMEPADNAIAFLDDDEAVSSTWLDELVDCAVRYNADVVAGPVLSILPDEAPDWLRKGGYLQRRLRSTGDTSGLPATNNVLIRRALLERYPDVRFDGSFSVTGGSDTDFFSRLITPDVRMVWCRTAVVHEYVQTERVTFRWLVARFTRAGEVHGRVRLRSESRIRLAVEAIGCCAIAVAAAPVTALVLRRERRRNLILFCWGRGILRSLRGRLHTEYAR